MTPEPASLNSAELNPACPSWRQSVPEIFLILCIFFLASPSPPPGVNEPHYLCRLKHAADPSYCAGDLFLESSDAHITFVYCFSWLTEWMPLEQLAWVGKIAVWLAVAWAWQRLSWAVLPRPLFAVLGAGILVAAIDQGNFAGEWLVGGFEAKPIAYVFVLLGLRAWVLNNWNLVWIHFGIATAWHTLVGGWSVLIMLGIWGLGFRRQQPLFAMLPGLALGGCVGLVSIVPALMLSAGQPPEVRTEAAEIYVYERLPHHLAPFHKSAEWIAERAGRHSVVVTLLVGLAAAHILNRRVLGSDLRNDAALRLTQFAVGAMLLAMIGVAIELAFWNQPHIAAPWLRFYWFRMTDVATPVALSILATCVLHQLFRARSRWAALALLVALALCGNFLTSTTLRHWNEPVARSDAKMSSHVDWRAACHWIRENTPPHALFLTPRQSQSFKWHAERAEVVTYKDVPQDAASLVEWRRRLYEVFKLEGNPNRLWARSIEQLGTPRVQHLAGKYLFDYIISRRANPNGYGLDLPVVFENETYIVYSVPNRK